MSYIEQIGLEPIKEFVEKSLSTYGTGEATDVAEKVADVTYKLLEAKGLVQQHGNQTFVDCLIAAALVHDLFKPGPETTDVDFSKDWVYIFDARAMLTSVGDEVDLPEQVQNGIYEAVEAQLGDLTPVLKCRPQPGTPQEIFANAVWFVNTYLA